MAPERTAACTLTLPPEIWRIVLHSFGTYRQDLAELWTGCRGVSKHFKHEVEEFFIAHYLPVTLLGFDMTTSQIFNRNSRIEFHDHKIQTTYSHVSVDRAKAFFQAKNSDGATLLEKMHNRGRYSRPSHLVDFSRPSDDVAWPGVFFHANGDVEVDWRELFAALFAEDMYHYRTGLHPVRITSQSSSCSPPNARIDDQTQVPEKMPAGPSLKERMDH